MILNIIRHERTGTFSVWVDGRQDLWEYGNSVAEAVGNLVTRYPETFQVELKIESDEQVPKPLS